jgi:hypothetical protein
MFVFGRFIRNYVVLATAFTMHAKSIVPNLETSCNASQFLNLENLIGSVHRYAPKYVHVFVRDLGLSKGQRMLLQRYQNVKIVAAMDVIIEKIQSIDVEKELVMIDGTYIQRKSNGKLLYVDSIRKRFHLAIVIPFIRSQLSNLKLQLELSKIYTPCEYPSDSVDLIFYHNEERYSLLEMDVRHIKYTNKCYRNIHFLGVNLTMEENQYPLGSFLMWQKLLVHHKNNNVSLRAYGYTHFFLMEPDTRPIRQFWLDAIISQITDDRLEKQYLSTKWWISGSIYRGSRIIGQRFLHINGNAIYHLSANFIAYVKYFSRVYLTPQYSTNGYDLVIFSLLLDNQTLGQRLWHKFRFSDFIQNCWQTGCEGSDLLNNTQFILNNPDTYLIHGRYVKMITNEQKPNRINVIITLLVVVNFIILWQYRWLHRRLKLKRLLKLFSFLKLSSKTSKTNVRYY